MERMAFTVHDGQDLQFFAGNFLPIVKRIGKAAQQTAPDAVIDHAPAQRELFKIDHRFIHGGNEISTQARPLAFIILGRFGECSGSASLPGLVAPCGARNPVGLAVEDDPHQGERSADKAPARLWA